MMQPGIRTVHHCTVVPP